MTVVSITAFFMGLYRLTINAGPDPDAILFSWFLIFISILSSATAWYGIKVLRYKRRTTVHITSYGWVIGFALLQYFPIVGIFLGSTQLLYWLKVPKAKSHWAVEHIVGMLSCCISTVTAFTVFGAPRLLNIKAVSLFVWFLPTVILVPLIIGFSLTYMKKMDGSRPNNTYLDKT